MNDDGGPGIQDHAVTEIARAHATLLRAATFLGASNPSGRVSGDARRYRIRALGNHLRELDCLLRVLIAATRHPLVRGVRDTAGKLESMDGDFAPSRARLEALRRSRDCMFHCGGRVRLGDGRGAVSMTAGWPALNAHRLPVGGELTISADELADVCAFYVDIADRLIAGPACDPVRASAHRARRVPHASAPAS